MFPVDHSLEPEEIATRQIKLLEAGVIGEPHADPDTYPEVQRLYFDVDRPLRRHERGQRRAVHGPVATSTTPTRGTSSSRTARRGPSPGIAAGADLTFETSWGDWIAISKGALPPGTAVLRRRLRFRGSPRKLRTFTQLFPRRARSRCRRS